MNYISSKNFIQVLNVLKKEYQLYLPNKKNNQRFYKKYSEFSDDITIGEVRAFEPLKAFFFGARAKVSEDFKSDVPISKEKPYAIIGVKACDLKGFKVLDFVFKGEDVIDPFYAKARENNLIISADCTCAIETCFCLALDVKPYPQENFDINLSQVKGGFIVETGSQKGREIVEKNSSLFEDAKTEFINERDEQRVRVIKEVEKNIQEKEIPRQERFKGIIEKNYESNIWKEEAETCVECGACNSICPTCHCFLLFDQKDNQHLARFRLWDSCMIKDFARVAGGANPRHKLWMRLRNRFEKKFDFFPKLANIYACTGCGRCVSACPAKIDIRKVLKRLSGNGK